jgi:hypothetical protein
MSEKNKNIDNLFQVGLNEKPKSLIDKLVKRALSSVDFGIPIKRIRSYQLQSEKADQPKKTTFGDVITEVEKNTPKERSFPYEEWKEKIKNEELELIPNATSEKLSLEQLEEVKKAIFELLTHNHGLNPKYSSRIYSDNIDIPKRLRYIVSYEPGKFMLC